MTLQQYKVNVGDEVKAAVREAVQQVLPVLLTADGDGSLSAAQQQAASESQMTDQLQVTHSKRFEECCPCNSADSSWPLYSLL